MWNTSIFVALTNVELERNNAKQVSKRDLVTVISSSQFEVDKAFRIRGNKLFCGCLESGRLRASTNTRRNKECASTGTRCERYELSSTWLSTNRRKDSLRAKSVPSCTKPQGKATMNQRDLHTSSGGRRIRMRLNITWMLSDKIGETIDCRFWYPSGSCLEPLWDKPPSVRDWIQRLKLSKIVHLERGRAWPSGINRI